MARKDTQFAEFADGRVFRVRVTPKAASNQISADPTGQFDFRVRVTVAPENGKANQAVGRLLAKAIGVPKSRIELLGGTTSRDKQFRVR